MKLKFSILGCLIILVISLSLSLIFVNIAYAFSLYDILELPKTYIKKFFEREVSTTYDFEVDKVFGQPDITETAPNQVVGNRVFHAQGVLVDRSVTPNRVYVWDSGNSRILGFSSLGVCVGGPNANNECTNDLDCPSSTCNIDSYKKANIIIGQPDEFHSACNGNNNDWAQASASTLCSQPYPNTISIMESPEPSQMAVDSNHNLYVFDKWNHRVLKYNDPFATDTIADFVWGQENFNDRECNRGNLYSPTRRSLCSNNEHYNNHISGDNKGAGVDVDSYGNVWVADVSNNRVLRFPPNSKGADLVIGQQDFTSRRTYSCSFSPSDNYLCRPKTVRYNYHTDQLFVIDWPDPVEISRILIYNPPFTNGMSPSEIINARKEGASEYKLYRPIGIEIDPFSQDGFWINDVDNSRILYFKKIGGTWTPTKVLSQHNLEKTGCGSFSCATTGQPDEMCEACNAGGGIGIDSMGNIITTDDLRQHLLRFPAPIPDASDLNGLGYPADFIIMKSQENVFGHDGVNYVSEYGIHSPDSVLLVNYDSGIDQLFVADHHRVLFWNDYKNKQTGSPADGVLFQDDFNSKIPRGDIISQMTSDSQGKVWMIKGSEVYVFNGPISNKQQPNHIIPSTLSLRFGGTITSGYLVGLAYDEQNDALWVSDIQNHRVVRIHHPLDLSKREVDMVLGQSNIGSTEANRGVDVTSEMTCPHVVPDGFGNLGFLRLDNYGNLYIVDATYEGWQCSNNRVVEYDREDLIPDPNKNFFADRERVSKRVYGKPDFTSKDNRPIEDRVPNTPISVSFTSDNRMLMTVDAYGNKAKERIFLYDDPLPACSTPCSVEHSSIIHIQVSQGGDSSWDNEGNLVILDHTWNRILFFDKPFGGESTTTSSTIPTTSTPTTTTQPGTSTSTSTIVTSSSTTSTTSVSTTTISSTTSSTSTTSTTTILNIKIGCQHDQIKVNQKNNCTVSNCSSGMWIVTGIPIGNPIIKDIPPNNIEFIPSIIGNVTVKVSCFDPLYSPPKKEIKVVLITTTTIAQTQTTIRSLTTSKTTIPLTTAISRTTTSKVETTTVEPAETTTSRSIPESKKTPPLLDKQTIGIVVAGIFTSIIIFFGITRVFGG